MLIRPPRFLALPFLLSLAGLLFCCWNLWGAPEVLCVTEGCRLFQDFSAGGISLWTIGAAAFTALLLAALLGFASAGYWAATCGLALDCVLLVVMIAAAPCFNCLIIGLLLALVFLAFRSARRERREEGRISERWRPRRSASPLFAVWALLFLLDAGVVAHGLMEPWPLFAGNAGGAARIYFSPSCEACRALVAASAGEAADIAWYPVAERSGDLDVIADIARRTAEGESLPAALDAALESARLSSLTSAASVLSLPQRAVLQIRLWRNRAHVLEAGSERLPFVEFAGAPSVLLRGAPSHMPADIPSGDSSGTSAPGGAATAPRGREGENVSRVDDSLFGVSGFCAGEEPCEAPQDAARGSLHEFMSGGR